MRLSVVMTIVDGGAALERCLTALAAQDAPPPLEVLVPYDDSVPGIEPLRARFPAFRWLPLGPVSTDRQQDSQAGQHELIDRRRSAGLGAAGGDLVAILEDRGVPSPHWARTIVALHERLPNAVIGGAIDNGRDATLNWAVYFCDFGRYQPPFEPGPRPYVSDVNVSYKRRALEQTRELWQGRYHETTVHWALQRAGEQLYLSPEFGVHEIRDDLRLRGLLSERLGWGRLFAHTRAREIGTVKRLALAGLAPVLPVLLFTRLILHQRRRHQTMGPFLRAIPIVVLLLGAWSLGEAAGYLTGRP